MAIIVYIEHSEGKIKKSSLEAAFYASKLGDKVIGVAGGAIDNGELENLGAYGVSEVMHAADERLNHFDSKSHAKMVSEAAKSAGANTVVVSFNQNGKALAPRVAIRLEAGYVPGATSLPGADGLISKNAFSGKGIAHYKVETANKVIGLNPNSLPLEKGDGSATVNSFDPQLADSDYSVTVKGVEKLSGDIPLTEAELVVSGGRGLRGPENWGMIEDLAKDMGAATACSRAVADVDWRPHHEHVGQTGGTIRPNLYIAVAISGAIQHLAGVNGSKTIVVINNDPEAPFFKAADYGIVGDAFEVMPRLIESYRKFKAASN